MVEKRGYFISFEGPEGGGKTTQVRRLINYLETRGIVAKYTREPGGTATGEAIRGILQHNSANEPLSPETEVLLFAASRAQLVKRVIAPALEIGEWVVSDRFADSTTVYQGYGRGFDVKTLRKINDFAVGNNYPNLTFLLDLDVDEGLRRISARSGGILDRIEREERPFHERIRQGYLEIAKAEPQRFCVLDASRDVELVHEQILTTLKEKSLV
jgi:dTMP kinase